MRSRHSFAHASCGLVAGVRAKLAMDGQAPESGQDALTEGKANSGQQAAAAVRKPIAH
jgi:hypothetical protein